MAIEYEWNGNHGYIVFLTNAIDCRPHYGNTTYVSLDRQLFYILYIWQFKAFLSKLLVQKNKKITGTQSLEHSLTSVISCNNPESIVTQKSFGQSLNFQINRKQIITDIF